MRRFVTVLICILPLSIGCGDNTSTAPEPGTMALVFDPARVNAVPNEEFVLAVQLQNAVGVFGVTFDVVFEPDRAMVLPDSGVTTGDMFGDTPVQLAISERGRTSIGVSLVQTEDVDAVTGTGVVANVRFISSSTDRSEIRFDSIVAIDENGAPLTLAVGDPVRVN